MQQEPFQSQSEADLPAFNIAFTSKSQIARTPVKSKAPYIMTTRSMASKKEFLE
jgi:hypothetical protein